MFASCDNPSDTNSDSGGNNTTLVNGNNNNNSNNSNSNNSNSNNSNSNDENLIKKTIRFVSENDSDCYLELKTDGTARYYDDEKIPTYEFKYTFDENKKEIYMKVEKYCDGGFDEKDLLTYDELRSKINEMEVEDDYVEDFRQMYEGIYKAIFGAQITYTYKTKDGKMTLAEKFTGVKNLLNSECRYSDGADYLGISCSVAYLHFGDDDGDSIAYLGTDNKTIDFVSKNINATYTEDLDKETVTINCEGKKYICKFEGENFTQAE